MPPIYDEDAGEYSRDLDVLPDCEAKRLKELEDRHEELSDRMHSMSSSNPKYHNVIMNHRHTFNQLESFRAYLDSNWPDWRERNRTE